MSRVPRVAAIHDLAGFGRCSLTVVMPVLSAMGVQCCPLPTACLSTHTGGFEGVAAVDLTDHMEATLRHWVGEGIRFEGVYTGYLASPRQAELCARAMDSLKSPDGLGVVDPVLGDHGRLYRGITPALGEAMKGLCRRADVITPNLTEAAFLLGEDYEAAAAADPGALAQRLSLDGQRSVVLTGIARQGGVGAFCLDRKTGRGELVLAPRVEGDFHGTGDIFAAVLTGGLLLGKPLGDAAGQAARFVAHCAASTAKADIPRREGVELEPFLWMLEKGL